MSDERKPVWEETWRGRHSVRCTYDVYCEEVRDYILRGEGQNERDAQRARLAAAAPDMARALIDVEWSGWDDYYGDSCPSCSAPKSRFTSLDPNPAPKHEPDCALDAALKKAGVR